MQAGNMGGEDGMLVKDVSQSSIHDLSFSEFDSAWLTLKELHDKEVHSLQAKLASLRKERRAKERRSGTKAKIQELTEQQKVLSDTINDLKDQLNSKTCSHYSVNDGYYRGLRHDFYETQQDNLQLIAKLKRENKKLKSQNKILCEKLNPRPELFCASFSDSDNDGNNVFLSNQKIAYTVKEPPPGAYMRMTKKQAVPSRIELVTSPETNEPKQSSKKNTEVPETSEKTSNASKRSTEGKTDHTSPAGPSCGSSFDPEKWPGGDDNTNLPESQLGGSKKKLERKSTQRCKTMLDLSWSTSSVSSEENQKAPLVYETSEENMPGYNPNPESSSKKKKPPMKVFPYDYTSTSARKRSSRFAHSNIGIGAREVNFPKSTGTEYATDKPPLKRKAMTQLEKKEKATFSHHYS